MGQDVAIWASLFFYHFGPTMEMHDPRHFEAGKVRLT